MKTETKPLKQSFLEQHLWLFSSCAFSYFLLCGRLFATGSLTYVFLMWNLFLAAIPYVISNLLAAPGVVKTKSRLYLLLVCWLLFIPNSFYIVTDLFHLRTVGSAPAWFDLLLIYSFAWNGLLMGLLSIHKTETLLEKLFGRRGSTVAVFVLMFLVALGIYTGRFLRYNSWDVLMQPKPLFADLGYLLIFPFHNGKEWAMIICYAAFMMLAYLAVRGAGRILNQKTT